MTAGSPPGYMALHQTVHGYRRGHELLATSLTLEEQDRDCLTQLSDLSGLPIDPSIPSYLTCYPLPSRRYYAIARTWLDKTAPRSGCVLTHTLIIPSDFWRSSRRAARSIVKEHRRPDRSNLINIKLPLNLRVQADHEGARSQSINDRDFSSFTTAFFGSTRSPVVWFWTGDQADNFAIDFLDFLWPSLRSEFSLCTYALQPRSVGARPFDLMMAPAGALSRFSRFHPERLVGYNSIERPSPIDPLQQRLVRSVEEAFRSTSPDIDTTSIGRGWPTLDRMAGILPPDPAALLKVVMLDDLKERIDSTPSAAVAVLDVIAAIAPQPDAARDEKRESLILAADRALRAETLLGLDLLAAIVQRCSKPPFRFFRVFRRDLINMISDRVAEFPRAGLIMLTRTRTRRSDLASAVARGLSQAPEGALEDLGKFWLQAPDRIRMLFRFNPALPRQFLDGMDGDAEDYKNSLSLVEAWYRDASQTTQLRIARRLFSCPVIYSLQNNVLELILHSAALPDIPTIIWALKGSPFRADIGNELKFLAQKFPAEIAAILISEGITSELQAILLAETMFFNSVTSEQMDELFSSHHASDAPFWVFKRIAHQPHIMQSLPYLLGSNSHRWIALLIRYDGPQARDLAAVIRVLMRSCSADDLCNVISPRDETSAVWDVVGGEVVDKMLACIIRRFVRGSMQGGPFGAWLRSRSMQAALERASFADLVREILQGEPLAREQLIRIWSWFADVGPKLQDWSGRVLPSACEEIFRAGRGSWSMEATQHWADFLLRRRELTHSYGPEAVEFQAVQIALSNNALPLSPVLVCAFPSVYRSTVAGGSFLDVFSYYTDWDRGKDLRRRLVNAYASSQWPPGDLALAASRAGILEKIVSRASRTRGRRLLLAARDDLDQRADYESISVRNHLESLLGSNRVEDWD